MLNPEAPVPPVEAAIGYDRLSQEYYSPTHKTCRNFDEASSAALPKGDAILPGSGLILDLGCGRGRVGEFLGVSKERVIQCDISNAMLTITPREDCLLRIVCDARATPFLDETFSAITSFLFDPFNTPELYREVARLLAPGGIFIGTLPAFGWGMALRDELGIPRDITRFRLHDGGILVTRSFLSSNEELVEMCNVVGLDAQVRSVPLPTGAAPLSPDIVRPAAALNIDPYTLPVVQVLRARKPL